MGSATGPTRVPSNSNYTARTWYAYIEWSISYPTNTTAKISATLYFRGAKKDWGQVGKYVNGGISIEGVTVASFAKGDQSWQFSQLTSKQVLTGSRTVSRTTAAHNVAVSGWVNINSPSAYASSAGTSTASGTQSVAARPSYAVNYYGNGATSGSTAAQTKYYDTTLALRSNGFVRTGYTYQRWNTNAGGTGTNYNAGANYTGNAALNLYAQWKANTYNVIYNANGGSGTMSNSVMTYNTAANLQANSFTRSDWLFAGWATSANGGKVYDDGASVKNLATSGNYNLYALWEYQFVKPNLQFPLAIRRGEWDATSQTFEEDDTGNNAEVQVHVIPATIRNTLNSEPEYTDMQVEAFYKRAGDIDYTLLQPSYTVNTPTTLNWRIINPTGVALETELQYDILFIATPVVEVGGEQVEKIELATSLSTFISSAEFTVDINKRGTSLGLFEVAPGVYIDSEDNSIVKTLGVQGDLLFTVDGNILEGVDADITTGLTALALVGWNCEVDPMNDIQEDALHTTNENNGSTEEEEE